MRLFRSLLALALALVPASAQAWHGCHHCQPQALMMVQAAPVQHFAAVASYTPAYTASYLMQPSYASFAPSYGFAPSYASYGPSYGLAPHYQASYQTLAMPTADVGEHPAIARLRAAVDSLPGVAPAAAPPNTIEAALKRQNDAIGSIVNVTIDHEKRIKALEAKVK